MAALHTRPQTLQEGWDACFAHQKPPGHWMRCEEGQRASKPRRALKSVAINSPQTRAQDRAAGQMRELCAARVTALIPPHKKELGLCSAACGRARPRCAHKKRHQIALMPCLVKTCAAPRQERARACRAAYSSSAAAFCML